MVGLTQRKLEKELERIRVDLHRQRAEKACLNWSREWVSYETNLAANSSHHRPQRVSNGLMRS